MVHRPSFYSGVLNVANPYDDFVTSTNNIGFGREADLYAFPQGTNSLVLENLPVDGAGLLLDNLMQSKNGKGQWLSQIVRSFFVNETGNIQFDNLRDSIYSLVFNSLEYSRHNRYNLKVGEERNIIRLAPVTIPSYAVITSVAAGLESYNYVSDSIPRLLTYSGLSTNLYISGCADADTLLALVSEDDVCRYLDNDVIKFNDVSSIDAGNYIVTLDTEIVDFPLGSTTDFLNGSGIGGSPYITLNWRRDLSNQYPQYWTIFYKWSGVEWQYNSHVDGNRLSATINELSFETDYEFKIRGVGVSYQNSRWSNVVTITTPTQEGLATATDTSSIEADIICLKKMEDLKEKFVAATWASYCILENFCTSGLRNYAADEANPLVYVDNAISQTGLAAVSTPYTYTSVMKELDDSQVVSQFMVYTAADEIVPYDTDNSQAWIKIEAMFSGLDTSNEIVEVYSLSGHTVHVYDIGSGLVLGSNYEMFGFRVRMGAEAGFMSNLGSVDRVGIYVDPTPISGYPADPVYT